jgi:hypothetical protein
VGEKVTVEAEITLAVAIVGWIGWLIDRVLQWRVKSVEVGTTIKVEGADWVDFRFSESYESFLRELVGLDYASVPDLNQENEGLPGQWAPIFKASPDTWRVLVYRDSVIVGYWSFFFVAPKFISDLSAGIKSEGEFDPSDFRAPTSGESGPIFVSMVALHPALTRMGSAVRRRASRLLYSSMLSAIDELNDRGISPTDVYMVPYSNEAERLSRDLNFTRLDPTNRFGLCRVAWNSELRAKLALRT